MAAISCSLQPASASRRHAALRSPCDEQCFGKSASSHHSRNTLPKPAEENAAPVTLVKNVICPAIGAQIEEWRATVTRLCDDASTELPEVKLLSFIEVAQVLNAFATSTCAI